MAPRSDRHSELPERLAAAGTDFRPFFSAILRADAPPRPAVGVYLTDVMARFISAPRSSGAVGDRAAVWIRKRLPFGERSGSGLNECALSTMALWRQMLEPSQCHAWPISALSGW
jgi:hypothetical protein